MNDTVNGLLDLVLWRDGGQRQARRNAWRAMVADNVRARARADADAALRAEVAASAVPVSSTHGAQGEGRVGNG